MSKDFLPKYGNIPLYESCFSYLMEKLYKTTIAQSGKTNEQALTPFNIYPKSTNVIKYIIIEIKCICSS